MGISLQIINELRKLLENKIDPSAKLIKVISEKHKVRTFSFSITLYDEDFAWSYEDK